MFIFLKSFIDIFLLKTLKLDVDGSKDIVFEFLFFKEL